MPGTHHVHGLTQHGTLSTKHPAASHYPKLCTTKHTTHNKNLSMSFYNKEAWRARAACWSCSLGALVRGEQGDRGLRVLLFLEDYIPLVNKYHFLNLEHTQLCLPPA